MGFSNWKILILFEYAKDLSINSASLLLSMSKQICISAMLFLNIRCLPLTLTILFCIAQVDILTRFSVVLVLSTISFIHSLWWWFLPGTIFFLILPMTRIFLVWHFFCTWHSAFSFCLFVFSYLDIQSLLPGDLIYNNSSSVLALTMSHGRCLSVLKSLFVVCAIVQSIQ